MSCLDLAISIDAYTKPCDINNSESFTFVFAAKFIETLLAWKFNPTQLAIINLLY